MPDSTNKAHVARAVVFLSLLGISFSGPLGKLAMLQGPAPLAVAFWRMVFTCLFLLPLSFGPKSARQSFRALWGKACIPVVLAGLFLSLHYWSWYTALGATSVFNTTVLASLQPFFAMLAVWLLFREKPQVWALLGAVLSIGGMVVMGWAGSRGGVSVIGDLMAMASGLMMALYFVCGRLCRQKLSVQAYAFSAFAVCTAAIGLLAALSGQSLRVNGNVLLLCLGLAGTASLVGHTAVNWSLKYVGVTFVTMAMVGEPVGATLLGWAMMGTVPTAVTAAGGVLIIIGVMVYSYMDHRIYTKRMKGNEVGG
jgi:drug/metabolite transporter (DMT)-like permease